MEVLRCQREIASHTRKKLCVALPYAGWVSADGGWRLWGLAGLGSGRAGITEDGVDAAGESGVSMAGAALGATRELWRGGGTVLRGKAELSFAQLDLDGGAAAGGEPALGAQTVDTGRVRFGLEASRGRSLTDGQRLEFALSAGGRGDFGGGGALALELGPRLRYADPKLGLTVEGRGHLLAGISGDAGEWGIAFTAGYDPRVRGRGPAFSLASGYGAQGGGAFGLWERQLAEAAVPASGGSAPQPRLEARLQYGLPLPPRAPDPLLELRDVRHRPEKLSLGRRMGRRRTPALRTARRAGREPARTRLAPLLAHRRGKVLTPTPGTVRRRPGPRRKHG